MKRNRSIIKKKNTRNQHPLGVWVEKAPPSEAEALAAKLLRVGKPHLPYRLALRVVRCEITIDEAIEIQRMATAKPKLTSSGAPRHTRRRYEAGVSKIYGNPHKLRPILGTTQGHPKS
jgi:hypothetical protein